VPATTTIVHSGLDARLHVKEDARIDDSGMRQVLAEETEGMLWYPHTEAKNQYRKLTHCTVRS
jgi:hypothetical protein